MIQSVSNLSAPSRLNISYVDVLHNALQYYEVIIFDCTSDLPEMKRATKISSLEDARDFFDDFGPDRFHALLFIEPPEEASEWIKHLPRHECYWGISRAELSLFTQRYPKLLDSVDNDPYCILPQLFISKYPVVKALFASDKHRHSVIARDTEEIAHQIVYVNVTHHNPEVGDYAFPIYDAIDEDLAPVIHRVLHVYNQEVILGGKTMIVFCDKGQSRSGSAVLYLVCRLCNIPVEEGLETIKAIYPDISPNDGFMEQLRKLLESAVPYC